jgi:tetratricopeptide (TPR) repeat protein
VSGQDEATVQAALAELVRREVFSVSADPLSPELGNYRFAQEMLRQVAYETLSRRDRKTRHLRVAAHLRAAFAGDGEEMTEVIARHYLDALTAMPDDPDTAEIRGEAVTALIRAAERAERTGAPALASSSYARAAELTSAPAEDGQDASAGQPDVGMLWERAALAAVTAGDTSAAVDYAGRAREYHLRRDGARPAARAQAIAGAALRLRGRLAEAHEQLASALDVLRANPDTDTVRALQELATAAVFAGAPEADRLSTEALILGQDLNVGPGRLGGLFVVRAIYLGLSQRRSEALAYLREAVQLATQAGDGVGLGRALLNMTDVQSSTDAAAAVETARSAAGHLRRTGARDYLAVATMNLAHSLMLVGDWDAAAVELTEALESDGLADEQHLICMRGWLAALRGDAGTAQATLARVPDVLASEDAQDQATVNLVEALIATARRRPAETLRHAQSALGHADAFGFSHECVRWAWPLACRAAHELGDPAAIGELLILLDNSQPGRVPPMLRAERILVRARLNAQTEGPAAGPAFADAIRRLREQSTPYHLAHGLLDQAEHLIRQGDAEAAATAVEEARSTATRLRCQPLLDRVAEITAAEPRIPA